jgi:hypothetical protein
MEEIKKPKENKGSYRNETEKQRVSKYIGKK